MAAVSDFGKKSLGLKIPSDACLVPSDPASVHRGRSRGDPISAAVPFDCLSALAAAVCRSGAWADLGAWDYLWAQAGEAIGDQFPFPGAVDKQRTLDSPTKGGFGNGRPKIKYVINRGFPLIRIIRFRIALRSWRVMAGCSRCRCGAHSALVEAGAVPFMGSHPTRTSTTERNLLTPPSVLR